jgi:murein DD-endopeptidase MepM/ murein hydrolase activator NlpD
MTQLGNERCYVDAGELSLNEPGHDIYHHYGIDIGGYDKAVPVVAAVGGTVVRRGEEWAPDETPDENTDENQRDDVVRIKDNIGWRYRYSHLNTIAPDIKIGSTIAAGDPVGILGKKGYSGGWSHLHFEIRAPQPSGRYGQVDAYPFFVEAYLNEHPGALLACARPHRVAPVGSKVELDGTRSLCDGGRITSYRWTFHNGKYEREGMYSEMLTVTDNRGKSDVDFCVVQILPTDADPARTPPSIHIAYYPTNNLRAAQPIAFKARSFIRGPFAVNKGGEELWDFGDGTTAVTCSDDNFDECWHAYENPGRYIVTVRRTGKNDRTTMAQLKLIVEE